MVTQFSSAQKVLIRVDYNVPIQSGKILDLTRIEKSIPTLRFFLKRGMSIVLMSHMGRPLNRDKKHSLEILLNPLEKLLETPVFFIPKIEEIKKDKHFSKVTLLENLRFYEGEINNDINFARRLSCYGDIYVNDAFGASHRNHGSISAIHKYFQHKKYKGFLLEEELRELRKLKLHPKSPHTIIVGGAKIGSKIHMLKTFLSIADNILIGGGMAFPFIKCLGGDIGNSLYYEKEIKVVESFLTSAEKSKTKIFLPTDSVITKSITPPIDSRLANIMNIPQNYMGVDIGPKTIQLFKKIINKSKSIIWNGPMGVSEIDKFADGTKSVAESIASSTTKGAHTLIGGGDTISDVSRFCLKDKFSYASTGGGPC